MTDTLQAARDRASSIRFAGDRTPDSLYDPRGFNLALDALLHQSGVALSEALTPDLWHALARVCERLGVPTASVAATVYASAEVQAECFLADRDRCHLRFTSGLVNHLDEAEFEFVVGHEIGHFVLGHLRRYPGSDQSTAEFFIQMRSQEISVDRIGLIACGSLQVAVRALMKTVSGLTQKHLRFDIAAFVNQLHKGSAKPLPSVNNSTHPSMVIRSRALLWFSMSKAYAQWPAACVPNDLASIDHRVERDLNRYVAGAVKRELEDLRRTVLLWTLALRIVETGGFAKAAQTKLEELFDAQTVEGLRGFLSGGSKTALGTRILEKLSAARAALQAAAPTNYPAALASIEKDVEAFSVVLPPIQQKGRKATGKTLA